MNADRHAEASEAIACLRVRIADRWSSTAPHPIRSIEVREGLPWAVTVGPDSTRSPQAPVETWPFWAFIGTLRVTQWHESLRPMLELLGRPRELHGVPWSVLRKLELECLEVLETDLDGLPTEDLAKRCPRMREFVGVATGSLAPLAGLRALARVVLVMPLRRESVAMLASLETSERMFRTHAGHHLLTGQPGQLQITTTLDGNWFARDDEEVAALFEELEETNQQLQGVARWRVQVDAEEVPDLEAWLAQHGVECLPALNT